VKRVAKDEEFVGCVGTRDTEVEVALSLADPTLGSLLAFCSFHQHFVSTVPPEAYLLRESAALIKHIVNTYDVSSQVIQNIHKTLNCHIDDCHRLKNIFVSGG
jgi:hypothetical protein